MVPRRRGPALRLRVELPLREGANGHGGEVGGEEAEAAAVNSGVPVAGG